MPSHSVLENSGPFQPASVWRKKKDFGEEGSGEDARLTGLSGDNRPQFHCLVLAISG